MQFSLQSLLKVVFVASVFLSLRGLALSSTSDSEMFAILYCVPGTTAAAAAMAAIWSPQKASWKSPTVSAGLGGLLATLSILIEIDCRLPAEYFHWDAEIRTIIVVQTLIAAGIGLATGWLVIWFRTWW